MYGTVTRYFRNRGYGFIRGEDGNTYFVHHLNLYGEHLDSGYYIFFKPTLYGVYHKLLKEAGIPDRSDGRMHRLHDMRHTFCVNTLEQMQEKGFDLYTSLPLLSTYLGHRHIRETEHYLRLVENRQGSVLEKTEAYMPELFPKIGGTEHE